MFRRILFILLAAFVIAMAVPVRPAARLPQAERLDAASIASAEDGADVSLARQLKLSGQENLYAISVYCYGLPTDRLALAQGLEEPSRVTVYFDGMRYVGVTSTYNGAGEYFDLSGRSAAQLDGLTQEQYLQNRQTAAQTAEEKIRQASQNIHNYIVNVTSWN